MNQTLKRQGSDWSVARGFGLLSLYFIGLMAVVALENYLRSDLEWSEPAMMLVDGSAVILMLLFGLSKFHQWVAQRLFAAASLAMIGNLFLAGVATVCVLFIGIDPQALNGENWVAYAAILSSLVVLSYSVWRIWRVRSGD